MRNSEQHSEKGAVLLFSAPTLWGTRTAVGGFAPDGRQSFSAPAERGTRTAQACSPLTGGSFFAEPQRGIRRLRTAGTCRAPRRGKRVDTKVSTLLTPTSFNFLVWRRPETGDRFENRGTAKDFFYRRGAQCAPMSRHIRSAGYRTATHTVKSTQARHIRVAQLVSAL